MLDNPFPILKETLFAASIPLSLEYPTCPYKADGQRAAAPALAQLILTVLVEPPVGYMGGDCAPVHLRLDFE